jgi:uncharacterized protein DUF6491
MKRSIVRTLAALSVAAGLTAGSTASFAATTETEIDASRPVYEQVDSIPMLTRPYSWQAVDDETVVVWATPFDPYLVKLALKSYDLKFAQVIGITQFGSRVYAKFDAVKVRGFRYPIDSIYKMSREEARELVRSARA